MKSPVELMKGMKESLFKKYSGDAGKMLLHTGTLGWIFSAAGQIFGIAFNDKVDKKEKSFLIPQEIADAVINIGSFYTVTRFIQNKAQASVYTGKVLNSTIKNFCNKNGIQLGKESNIGKAILSKVDTIEQSMNINKEFGISVSAQDNAKMQNKMAELNKFYDQEYAPFESGVKVIGNITGAVLSSNIITPMLRNPIAAAKQKSLMARDKESNNQDKPVGNPSLDDYRAKIMSMPTGSIKI